MEIKENDRVEHEKTGHKGTVGYSQDSMANVLFDSAVDYVTMNKKELRLLRGIEAAEPGDTIIKKKHGEELIVTQVDRKYVYLAPEFDETYPTPVESFLSLVSQPCKLIKKKDKTYQPEKLPELTRDTWREYWGQECEFWADDHDHKGVGKLWGANPNPDIGSDICFISSKEIHEGKHFDHCRPLKPLGESGNE